ncbi:hypothetical protein [Paraburkholderia caribensis]|uniref:hypothetical protein n=1 Tax=Paraburkholderia caribensis TaxID=75105 RepID=UPI00078B362A|nr:hypothetical protein [Paraburkholderia caribensis]AMV44290.1 hypothetical protein ATN79_20320 [Paraburkholderia caribensis]
MAKIVGVHGVGKQFKGESSVRAEWLPAIEDGLARASRQVSLGNDFACAFYGYLFRPSGKAAIDPPLDAADVKADWERELLELWWREAARIDPALPGPGARTKFWTPSIVQRALNALSESRFFAGVAERALIYDLKQVHRYLSEPDVRRQACASIASVVGTDTTVVVAHSLGSVVAYEALCAHPEWSVKVFVTIGAPLGVSNLIFERLEPPPAAGVGAWPGNIERWINIADEGDVVALVKQLSTRFGPRVTDHLVSNGANAHDATRYLTSRELGDAVASGL